MENIHPASISNKKDESRGRGAFILSTIFIIYGFFIIITLYIISYLSARDFNRPLDERREDLLFWSGFSVITLISIITIVTLAFVLL